MIVKHWRLDNASNQSWLASQVSISFAAGMIASFITQPADVVKTYRQIAPNEYRSIYSTLKAINRVKFFRSLPDNRKSRKNQCFLDRRLLWFRSWLSSSSISSDTGVSDDLDSLWIIFKRKNLHIKHRCRSSSLSSGNAEPFIEDIFLYTGDGHVLLQTKNSEPDVFRE